MLLFLAVWTTHIIIHCKQNGDIRSRDHPTAPIPEASISRGVKICYFVKWIWFYMSCVDLYHDHFLYIIKWWNMLINFRVVLFQIGKQFSAIIKVTKCAPLCLDYSKLQKNSIGLGLGLVLLQFSRASLQSATGVSESRSVDKIFLATCTEKLTSRLVLGWAAFLDMSSVMELRLFLAIKADLSCAIEAKSSHYNYRSSS